MRIGRNEIIEELTEHMRKFGGEPGEWCVGTAREIGYRGQGAGDRENQSEARGLPAQAGPLPEGGRTPVNMLGLAYCEAHTPYAAAETVDYLISAFGLQSARDSRPGNVVFVYRSPTLEPVSTAPEPVFQHHP